MDIFPADVPSLNLRGKEKVTSHFGTALSIVMMLVLFFYGVNKF